MDLFDFENNCTRWVQNTLLEIIACPHFHIKNARFRDRFHVSQGKMEIARAV